MERLRNHLIICDQTWVEPFAARFLVLSSEKQVLVSTAANGKSQLLHDYAYLQTRALPLPPKCLLLGRIGTQTVAMLNLDEKQSPVEGELQWMEARGMLMQLNGTETALLSRALQLSHWLQHNRYCGVCGAPTQLQNEERVLRCRKCATLYYPQLAPCVIGVVRRDRHILLAQGLRHSHIYSAIAGFVEAGESAEEAFIREVREEVGLEIDAPKYLVSQSWPFPGQLMLGFVADYRSGELTLDPREIVHADWFDANSLPALPGHHTIARGLIEHALKTLEP